MFTRLASVRRGTYGVGGLPSGCAFGAASSPQGGAPGDYSPQSPTATAPLKEGRLWREGDYSPKRHLKVPAQAFGLS